MPYILDGRPIGLDRPFTHNDVQYPANWLRLATPDERAAIGITEVPDPPIYDQRFYWGYDQDGQLIPKEHGDLVTLWIATTRDTANKLLLPSDWMVVRQADNGTTMDPNWKMWRESVRLASNEKVLYIGTTNDTDELAAYVTSSQYNTWPNDPNTPAADTPVDGLESAGDGGEDTLIIDGGTTSGAIL